MSRAIAVIQNALVDGAALDELIRAIVFFGDSVLIRASYSVPRLPSFERGLVERKVRELEELGVLRFWAHEYEVDDSGSIQSSPIAGAKRAHVVLNQDGLRDAMKELDDQVQAAREQAYLAGAAQKQLRQGAAEVVGLREQLTSLVIASELHQDAIVSSYRGKQLLDSGLAGRRLESFNDQAIRYVLSSLNVGPLWRLSIEEIDAARSCSSAFKKLLDDKVVATAADRQNVTPQAVAEAFVSEYQEALRRLPMTPEKQALCRDVAWDIITTIVPPAILLKFGLKAYQWRKDAIGVKPFLMLSSIQARTANAGQQIVA